MFSGATAHMRYSKTRQFTPNQAQKKNQQKNNRSFLTNLLNEKLLITEVQSSSSLKEMLPRRSITPSFRQTNYDSIVDERKRAGSVPVIKFTLATSWKLQTEHVRALKITWNRLCDTPRSNCRGILAIIERVFEKFECKEKTLRDVFYRSAFINSMAECVEHRKMLRNVRRYSAHDTFNENDNNLIEKINSVATLRDHIHFFVSLISQVIQSLEKSPQDIFDHIDRIGCYHIYLKKYGFRASMWDKLGVCLIDGLVVQSCVRGFPEACRAWTIMIAALIDRLRSAPNHIVSKSDEITLRLSLPNICRRNSSCYKSLIVPLNKNPSSTSLSPNLSTKKTISNSNLNKS